MDILERLKEDKNVLYIYEIGLQIYGLFDGIDDRDFVLIVDETPDYLSESDYTFLTYNMKDWFEMVINGHMLTWECACLPKKYIHKEHVKLLLSTNPLQLRKNFEEFYNLSNLKTVADEESPLTFQKYLWSVVKYVKFANQIIENHKIVNLKEVKADYQKIVNGLIDNTDTAIQVFENCLSEPLRLFKSYTDDILRLSKIKKVIQNA